MLLEERPKHLIPPPQIRRTQEAAPKPGAAFIISGGIYVRSRYASAKPTCATNIITYMWVQEG